MKRCQDENKAAGAQAGHGGMARALRGGVRKTWAGQAGCRGGWTWPGQAGLYGKRSTGHQTVWTQPRRTVQRLVSGKPSFWTAVGSHRRVFSEGQEAAWVSK